MSTVAFLVSDWNQQSSDTLAKLGEKAYYFCVDKNNKNHVVKFVEDPNSYDGLGYKLQDNLNTYEFSKLETLPDFVLEIQKNNLKLVSNLEKTYDFNSLPPTECFYFMEESLTKKEVKKIFWSMKETIELFSQEEKDLFNIDKLYELVAYEEIKVVAFRSPKEEEPKEVISKKSGFENFRIFKKNK